MSSGRFPLGEPINRQQPEEWIAIPGRPNWFRHRLTGKEHYREPPVAPSVTFEPVDYLWTLWDNAAP